MHTGVFKTEAGRDKVRAYYQQILNFFPYHQHYVNTSYGKTFVVEAGDADKPPLILLHGSCSNSAFWFGDIPALAERFHVFAADIPGEAGNSEENRLNPDSADCADWLNELMDACRIGRAVLCGNSLGGWMALKFAVTAPARVSALVLLAASGITPAKETFVDQSRRSVESGGAQTESLQQTVIGEDAAPKEVLDFIRLILEHFIPMTGALPVFSDTQLKTLTMPVLFIAGTHDVTMEADRAAQRLTALVPHAQARVLEHCGHVVTGYTDTVLSFLNKVEQP